MTWDELTNLYKKSGIVLALGAGVSMGARLPNWTELLERLATESDATGRRLEYDQLIRNGLTLPIIASIFEEYSSGREKFVERVCKALYRTFPFFPDGVSKGNRVEFVRYVKEDNPTLHAVATFCAVSNGGTGRYEPNPLIRGIVTFNLRSLEAVGALATLRNWHRAPSESASD